MDLAHLYIALLAGGLTLLASIVAVRSASRIGLPALLAFLTLGLLLGEDAVGINFDNTQLAQNLGLVALALILIDGGLTTRWSDIRSVIVPAGILATVGVGLSTLLVAAGAHLLLGFTWNTSLLLGAIISSTDAAAVFSVLRNLGLPRRVSGLLEAESGFNDAPTVILVVVLSASTHAAIGPLNLLVTLVYELAVGGLVGVVIGRLGAWAARRVALPVSGLYPLTTVGLGIVSFAAAGAIHTSGFLAAYLSAMILGNSALPHRAATRSFAEGAAWLAQIGMFVMLGLLVDPSELGEALIPALVIGTVLLLLARPVSVTLSLLPFGIPWRERALISWAGLRGAVPIVLATIPVVTGYPDSRKLLNVVFVLVVAFTIVQGPVLPLVAKRLRLAQSGQVRDAEIEAAPLDILNASLITVTIPPKSRLHGLHLYELRLPKRSVINSVVRDGQLFVPDERDRLKIGDELMIITMAGAREDTEARLRALGRRGKLARWFGEDGREDPVGG